MSSPVSNIALNRVPTAGLDWRHWALSHAIWIVLAIAVVIGFNSWREEHDARLIAQQQIKISEAQVQGLEVQIKQRDQQTVQAIAPVIKIIHDVQTAPQAVAALPQVLNQPLPAPIVPQPDNSIVVPAPDILPIFDQVADDKVCRVQLDTADKDLADTQAIVAQRDDEIVALKKKPGFWHRMKSTAKVLGIGVGIGLVIAKYL